MIFIPKNNFLFLFILLSCFFACKKESIYTSREKPEVVINAGDIRLFQPAIILVSDTVYVLNTDLDIKPTQTLKIAAGTLIKVNNNLTISIQAKGKIEAQGNANQPIIFTINALPGSAGGVIGGTGGEKKMWKGIFVNGNYTAGNDNPTSSGILSYVRIEFAGQAKNNDNSVALLLKNVSKETILSNIQVSYSETSSIKISGGNCNANNILTYACTATDIILDNKYQGMLQNVLCFKHPYFFTGNENSGLKINDLETFPIISNLSIIGPDNQKGFSFRIFNPNTIAINVTGNSKFHITNSVVLGYPSGAFKFGNFASAVSFNAGESSLTNSLFHSNITTDIFYLNPYQFAPYTSNNLKDFILKPEFKNAQYLASSEFGLSNPYDYYNTNSPNPVPAAGSPLLQGATFANVFNNTFFKKVNYRGALGSGADDWLQGWTNFIPLQTNYNF